MIAVNISQSTEFDEFDATDITEEDAGQIERQRPQIRRPLIRDTSTMRRPRPLTHSTYPLSSSEELVNSITHGIGLVLSVIGAIVMAVALGRGDVWRVTGCGVYLASLITVYAMSTMMHSCHTPRWKSVLSSSRPRLDLFARCCDVHAICAGVLAHQRLVDFVRVDLGGRLTGVSGEGTVRLSRGSTGHMAACANRRDTVYFNTNIAWCDIHWCAVVDARWRRLLCRRSRVFC